MRPKRMVLTADGSTPVYPCNHYASNSVITLKVDYLGATTGNVGVEYTSDDVYAKGYNPNAGSSKWYAHATLTALTADAQGTMTFRPTGIRLTGNTIAGGAGVQLTIIENGGGS